MSISIPIRHCLTSDSTINDMQLGDLFAFAVVIPGQQTLIMCTSNEKERLQWRLAFTYSIHSVYLTGSVRNQLQFASLAQSRLKDMKSLALQVAQCKNRMLILPPSFRRVDKSVAQSQASLLDASGASIPSAAPLSKLRLSSAYPAKSPTSVIYQLAGRDVSDCGIQSDGPRHRAATAAAPISNLLQTMKPVASRAVDVVSTPRSLITVAPEVEAPPPKQQMDLRPHQVTASATLPPCSLALMSSSCLTIITAANMNRNCLLFQVLVSCSDDKRSELLEFFKQNAMRLSHHRFHVVGSFLHRQICDLLAPFKPDPPACIESLLDIVPTIKKGTVNAWIFFWQPRSVSLVLSEVQPSLASSRASCHITLATCRL